MDRLSIKDARNSLGDNKQASGGYAAGQLSNNLYVGRYRENGATALSYGNSGQLHSEGGEIGNPYFAVFYIDITSDTIGGNINLIVEGAPDFPSQPSGAIAAPTSGWVTAGQLEISPGVWDPRAEYRVSFSDSKYKWFRAKVAGTGNSKVTAFLMRG